MNKQERYYHWRNRMAQAGIRLDDAEALRRIEMALCRWGERECNGEVEVDEDTGKAYCMSDPSGDYRRLYPTANREAGALRRLAAIQARYPEVVFYHQTDPRGCALWALPRGELREGDTVDCVYTRGVACRY